VSAYGRLAVPILQSVSIAQFRSNNRWYKILWDGMTNKDNRVLRILAAYKIFKALTLVVAGIGALRLLHHNDADNVVTHLAEKLGLSPGGHYVNLALAKLANIPPKDFKDLGIGSFIYATLFFIEGIGLWLMKPWAEWFTAIITSSLIPLEILEIHRQPTISHVILLLLNIFVVAYLVMRIRKERPASH
jgi:uncharacterized membrane protein (DUF2068 family)